ncbi:MAG: choice-of-anchor X domain-containing protein, partial [Methanosarcinaceae archaeon]
MKPNAGSDEILFFARAALKNDAAVDYEIDPVSSEDIDQQGWYVYTHSIPVTAVDPGSLSGSLNLEILSPAANFTATKNVSEPVEVKITDDSGNPVTDSGLIFVNASFSNGNSNLQLFDDGTHGDTSAHDGIFTNEWLPVLINGGETATPCTVRASAKHATFGSAEATVNGTTSPPANPDSDAPVSDSPESDDQAPDLIIEDISWEPADPYENENMTFEVTLLNEGSGP